MREYIEIGQCPRNEIALEAGTPNFAANARRQCEAFIHAIRNYLGLEPDGAELQVKAFKNRKGTYFEVVCYYDGNSERAIKYASECESSAPATWEEGSVWPPRLIEENKVGTGRA